MIFKKEIQEHVSFELDINQMYIIPTHAEVVYNNPLGQSMLIGQIQKVSFGVCFKPYKENIAKLELAMLMSYNTLNPHDQ